MNLVRFSVSGTQGELGQKGEIGDPGRNGTVKDDHCKCLSKCAVFRTAQSC